MRAGFSPQLRPRFLLPQPRATSKQKRLRQGKEREGASLIEMLPALRVCSRHLAVRGAGAGAAGLGGRAGAGGGRAPTWEQARPAESPGNPRRLLLGNELPGPEVSFPRCSHGSRVAPKKTGIFFFPFRA